MPLRVFHTCVSWWVFSWVWATVSLQDSFQYSGHHQVICLYLKIPEDVVQLILLNRFQFVHIPFLWLVKFKFLAQFPVDHFARLVVSNLIYLITNLLHLLIILLIILSLSPHNLLLSLLLLWEFFIAALADDLPLEFEVELFGLYGISTFVGYLMPNSFLWK